MTDFTFLFEHRLPLAKFICWYWNQYQERISDAFSHVAVYVCLMCRVSVPGANQVSPSKKPRSRGLLHSLLCCLCHKEPDPLPIKTNAPLLVEKNGTLSKVSSSHNILLSLLLQIIKFLLSSHYVVFEQHVPAWLTATWCAKHVFSWIKENMLKTVYPGLESNAQQYWKYSMVSHQSVWLENTGRRGNDMLKTGDAQHH